MKKLLFIALSFSFFALNADAQVTRNVTSAQKVQSDSVHKRGQMMKDLNLSKAQQSQMKELHQNMEQQRNAIKNDASLTQDQKKAKMQELDKSQKEKMNSILTADQKAKMQADKKNWSKKNEDRKENGKMMKGLNLTDTQKAQMKANHDKMKQQRDAIKNDASLSQEQKKAKMQDLQKAERNNMSSILTPDQKAKMQADRKNWNGKKWNDKKDKDSTKNF